MSCIFKHVFKIYDQDSDCRYEVEINRDGLIDITEYDSGGLEVSRVTFNDYVQKYIIKALEGILQEETK